MPTHTVKRDYHAAFKTQGSNGIWIFTKQCDVDVGLSAGIYDAGDGNHIFMHGNVFSNVHQSVITAPGASTSDSPQPAAPSDLAALMLAGNNTVVENDGRIKSGPMMGSAVLAYGAFELHNSGLISGDQGVKFFSYDATIVNEKGGSIVSTDVVAIHSLASQLSHAKIVNEGRIIGEIAFDGGNEADHIVNRGMMKGDIVLGDNKNTIDNRGGTIDGVIQGGVNNDTLTTDKAADLLIEQNNGGVDTVKSTVSYTLSDNVERLFLLGKTNINATGNIGDNSLSGNIGDNRLAGGDGSDALDGGFGDDILRGGVGADTFGFATGYGKDEIADFAEGDKIYLANWTSVKNFNQLDHAARDHGSGVWISAGHDILIIDHLQKIDLQASDFEF